MTKREMFPYEKLSEAMQESESVSKIFPNTPDHSAVDGQILS